MISIDSSLKKPISPFSAIHTFKKTNLSTPTILRKTCPTTRVLNFHHKENIEVNHSKNFQDMKINFNFISEKETYAKNTWSNKKITFS